MPLNGVFGKRLVGVDHSDSRPRGVPDEEGVLAWIEASRILHELTGGSVTSVNNSHMHPMGGQIGASILYAAEITGDGYLWSRLADTVRWTLTTYLHYDGHYGWGGKGLINERFCYTDSLLLERFPDGSPASTWFFAHSWVSGAVLESLVGRILDFSRTDKAEALGIAGLRTRIRAGAVDGARGRLDARRGAALEHIPEAGQ